MSAASRGRVRTPLGLAILSCVVALSGLQVVPAAAQPAAGAPSCSGSPQLTLAPTLSADRAPDGSPVTAVPAASGKLTAVVVVHGWTGSSINQRKGVDGATQTGDFSHPITLSTNPLATPDGTRSMIGQLQLIPGAAVYTFDYHQYSARWVTDSHLGPALGNAIDCLYQATGQKVVVVAHSLGGLVTRWALNQTASSGRPRAGEVSTVVTFGTPNLGSQLDADASGVLEAARFVPDERTAAIATVVQAILDACGQVASNQLTGSGSACDMLPDLIKAFDGDAGKAMRPGSPELKALPGWPRGVTVDALAGENQLQVLKVGWFALPWQTSSVPIGDIPVTASSATAGSTEHKIATCNYQLSPIRYGTDQIGLALGLTSKADVAKPLWQYVSPCYHSNLIRTQELTNEALGAVADDIGSRQPVSAAQLASAPVPSLCQHNPGNLVNGTLPGIPANQGEVTLERQLTSQSSTNPGVVLTDLTGDGISDAAAVIVCNRGGVPWPSSVQLYRSGNGGLIRLGGISLETLSVPAGANEDSRDYVTQLIPTGGGIDVHWGAVRQNTCEACGSYDYSAHLSFNGKTVVASNVHQYTDLPTEQTFFSALAAGNAGTVNSLATPEVAQRMLRDAGQGLVHWTGQCYEQLDEFFHAGWPADAAAQFGEWPPSDGGTHGDRFCLIRSPSGVGPYGIVGFQHTGFRTWQAVDYISPGAYD